MNSNAFTPKAKDLNFNLLQQYATENLDYREKALQLITDDIGFEPEFKARYWPEILLRDCLKKHDLGLKSDLQLDYNVKIRCFLVRSTIEKEFPDQAKMLKVSAKESFPGSFSDFSKVAV